MEIWWKCTVSAVFWPDSPKLCGSCAFPQNFHNKKFGEITVFQEVKVTNNYLPFQEHVLMVWNSCFCIEKHNKHIYNGKPPKLHISWTNTKNDVFLGFFWSIIFIKLILLCSKLDNLSGQYILAFILNPWIRGLYKKVKFSIKNFFSECELLREKYPYLEFLPVCIFQHLDWIRRDAEY